MDFSHCLLGPLKYRLPTRFETIPSRPISHALAKTIAPAVDSGDQPRKGLPPPLERTLAEILAVEI